MHVGFSEVVIPELTVHWQESYYSASETDGSVEVCAELSTLQFEGSVQVDYATVGDSAEGVRIVFPLHTSVGETELNLCDKNSSLSI